MFVLRNRFGNPRACAWGMDSLLLGMLLASIVAVPATAQGPALSAWPMQGLNAQRTSASPFAGPAGANLARVSSGNAIGGIAIGQDALYVNGLGVAAIDFDGALLWRFGASIPQQTPAVGDDETVYFGTDGGTFYALNASLPGAFVDDQRTLRNGIKWSYPAGRTQSCPLIHDDGSVIIATLTAKVIKFNADGTVAWTFATAEENESQPALGHDGTIYIGSDDNTLYALNQNGTLKWKLNTSSDINGGPIVGSSLVYFTTSDFKLWAVDPAATAKKRVQWKVSVGKSSAWSFLGSRPACTETMVVTGGLGGVYAFDAATGTPKWKVPSSSDVWSQPAIDVNDRVYAHARNGTLQAINGTTGQLLWQRSVGNSSTYVEPAIDFDGSLYVGGFGVHKFNDNAAGAKDLTIFWLRPYPSPAEGQANQPSVLIPSDITSISAAVTRIDYYQDDNGDRQLDPGDTLVASDTDGDDGWNYKLPVLDPGQYTYFAQAFDDEEGVESNVVVSTFTVTPAAP